MHRMPRYGIRNDYHVRRLQLGFCELRVPLAVHCGGHVVVTVDVLQDVFVTIIILTADDISCLSAAHATLKSTQHRT